MFPRTLIAILCLGWFVVSSRADEPPKYKPIDAATIAAYEKIGAEYGGFVDDGFGIVNFLTGKIAAAKGLPGFCFDESLRDGTLSRFPRVQVPFGLNLNCMKVTDAGLKKLKSHKNLTALNLTETEITDAGLKELKELKNLTHLNLFATKITDAGLKELKALKNLSTLVLHGRKITDAGLKELKDLKNLTHLYLSSTSVTDAGVKELKEALPNCAIAR